MAYSSYPPARVETTPDPVTDRSRILPQLSALDLSRHAEDDVDPPSTFDFPTLQRDGSAVAVPHTRAPLRRFATPPAALSSLGARTSMAKRTITDSVSSFADSQYDMVQRDDLSDHDNDCDTASIASTEEDRDEEDDDLVDVEPYSSSAGDSGQLIDSTDDILDTPRQSTVTSFRPHLTLHSNKTRYSIAHTSEEGADDEVVVETDDRIFAPCGTEGHSNPRPTAAAKAWRAKGVSLPSLKTILTVFSLLVFTGIQLLRYSAPVTALSDHAAQKQALAFSLNAFTNATDATKVFDLDHLLPSPQLKTIDLWGFTFNTYQTQADVRFQVSSPNHFVVSLPARSRFFAPRLEAANVHRTGQQILYNQTQLIAGVYHIVIDTEQAYGLIVVDMEMKHSVPKSSASHNFGNRMLQRHTYEKATTDLSRTVSERGLVARKTAQSITGKVQNSVSAGVSTTRNVTTQLANYVTHDLQVVVNSTVKAIGKVRQVGKDLVVAEQKGITLLGDGIKHAISTSTNQTLHALLPARKLLKKRLRIAIDRSVAIREGMFKVVGRRPNKKDLASYTHSEVAVRRAELQARRTLRKAEHEARHKAKAATKEKPRAVAVIDL